MTKARKRNETATMANPVITYVVSFPVGLLTNELAVAMNTKPVIKVTAAVISSVVNIVMYLP